MNLRTVAPHVINKINRPEPEGRIRRPFAVAAMALLAMLIAFAPVAASDDGEIRAFVSSNGTAIIVGELPIDNRADGRAIVRMMDASALESSMDVLIIEQNPLSRDLTRMMGLSAGTISAGLMDDGTPFLLVLAANDDAVTLAMMAGDDLDGEMFAAWTFDLFWDGIDDIDAPFGYVEVPTDDRDTADTDNPFDDLVEGRI